MLAESQVGLHQSALGGLNIIASTVAAFKNDGVMPYAGVTADRKGNVYGMMLYGGIGGTVFELSPAGRQLERDHPIQLCQLPDKRRSARRRGDLRQSGQSLRHRVSGRGSQLRLRRGLQNDATSQRQVELHRAASLQGHGRLWPRLQPDFSTKTTNISTARPQRAAPAAMA